MNAIQKQVAGDHYRNMAIQPVQFITANHIPYIEGNVIKYVCRHRSKGGAQDLLKCVHYIEMLLENEYGATLEDVRSDEIREKDETIATLKAQLAQLISDKEIVDVVHEG